MFHDRQGIVSLWLFLIVSRLTLSQFKGLASHAIVMVAHTMGG